MDASSCRVYERQWYVVYECAPIYEPIIPKCDTVHTMCIPARGLFCVFQFCIYSCLCCFFLLSLKASDLLMFSLRVPGNLHARRYMGLLPLLISCNLYKLTFEILPVISVARVLFCCQFHYVAARPYTLSRSNDRVGNKSCSIVSSKCSCAVHSISSPGLLRAWKLCNSCSWTTNKDNS